MSFESQPPPIKPAWAGPPWHVQPGVTTLSVEIGRSSSTVVQLEGASVYEQGLVLRLVVRIRETDPEQWRRVLRGFTMFGEHRVHAPLTPPGLTWGVEFLDGRRTSTEAESPWATGAPEGMEIHAWAPDHPVIEAIGGPPSGFADSWSREVWLWPLPPPGVLKFFCSWPERSISPTMTATDIGTTLNEAASQNTPVWADESK